MVTTAPDAATLAPWPDDIDLDTKLADLRLANDDGRTAAVTAGLRELEAEIVWLRQQREDLRQARTHDATRMLRAEAERDELRTHLANVEAWHQPSAYRRGYCDGCDYTYPCATVEAARGVIGKRGEVAPDA